MSNAGFDLITLSEYLKNTLSPDVSVRKPAEKFLESIEGNQSYALLLLQLMDKNDCDITIRIAAAITFKNFVKRNWPINEDEISKICEQDRVNVKNLIVDLMLRSPELIQRQLSDALSIIGREDFPNKWPNLLDEMISNIQTSGANFTNINGVLQTAHSLFKRYRHEFKSQELWLEIKHVLDRFAKPFTDLFLYAVQMANTHTNNHQMLKIIFRCLVLCAKIFNSLNSQDLPEFFEDNMKLWMDNFLSLLSFDNKQLQTDIDDEVGLLEQLKSQICDNISLYAHKYDDEFKDYIHGFVQAVWKLLISTGPQPKYDLLVSNAMHFLSIVAERPQYQDLFKADGVLESISSNVIIPNIEFRESDEELFEDNPEEYIRRDIEGSDVDTRRRGACELVKALSKFFEPQIFAVFTQYINSMLTKYSANPKANWKSKDAAIYLVTSLAVKGSTARHGTTNISQLVNVNDFYNNFVKRDLEISADLDELPVLRADALKYITTFRNQLALNDIVSSIPLIINHLRAPKIVVHSYASVTLERILTLRDPSNNNLAAIKFSHIQTFMNPLLQNLFWILTCPGSTENEYTMKAIMRTFSLAQEGILPYLQETLPKLTSKLVEVSKNPCKPHFNHYLFETITLSIKIACQQNKSSVSNFEALLFPIFQVIIVQDVQEFMPYIFQILSILLEVYDAGMISDIYIQLFSFLLTPALWDRHANIAPLSSLLQVYVEKSFKQIVAIGKIEPLLGVFQKLLASKTNDHYGFYILQSLIQYGDPNTLSPYLKQIFVLLFQRLTSSKTTKYVKSLLVFFSFFIHHYGAHGLASIIDSIQANMFGMVIEKLFIQEVQKVSGTIERKICAVGMIKLLCDLDSLIIGQYSNYWCPLLYTLICLFELPEDDSIPENEHFIEIEDTPGYQASYSQLIFAGKKETDPFKDSIPNAKLFLAQSLAKLSVKHPGKLNPLINSGLVPDALTHLQNYLETANITII